MAYSVTDYDKLQPAEQMKIERRIYFHSENTDISHLTTLPVERLQTMRGESAAAEQAIFENLREASAAWEAQAAQTAMFDKAIEYTRTPAVKHTANQWEKDDYEHYTRSNMVYKMNYHISENTRYDRDAQKSVPYSWDLTWSVRTNTTDGYRGERIAGQDRKRYGDKAELEKYLAGRIKTYAHLFTEISPPIPQEYVKNFRVNGQLLSGYTVEGEPKPPDRAADIGGVSISENIEQRKELENMNEPLNIQLANREQYITRESGSVEGAWLKLPATAEQLNAVLARIGAQGGEHGKDFFINGIETPVAVFDKISLDNIQKAGIDELNYLAARLEAIEPVQLAKLNAAALVMSNSDDIHRLIEFTHNTDFFVHNPGVFNYSQLGENCLSDSEMVNMPEAWKGAVDVEKLGQIVAASEKGVFTEHGYILLFFKLIDVHFFKLINGGFKPILQISQCNLWDIFTIKNAGLYT